MVILWRVMEETYPWKWTMKLGEVGSSAYRTWQRGLAGLTAEQMAIGMARCATQRKDQWPPTLPEFRALCKGDVSAPYHRSFVRALPRPPADPEVVRTEIDQMRLALGKGRGKRPT